jgi:hypothetical protein
MDVIAFNMCKKNNHIWIKIWYYTNFKYNHTWQHDSLIKLGFMKSTSLEHVIFNNSYKLHQTSYELIANNLWLLLITFFEWSPIVWKPHQHVHMLLYSAHTYHGSPYQMTFWLNCPRNILHPNLHPILHLWTCPPNMLQTTKLFSDVWPFVEGNL